MLRLKKNSYKEFDEEKKFLRLENSPPPPHNFSNGPSLRRSLITKHFRQCSEKNRNYHSNFLSGRFHQKATASVIRSRCELFVISFREIF